MATVLSYELTTQPQQGYTQPTLIIKGDTFGPVLVPLSSAPCTVEDFSASIINILGALPTSTPMPE